MNDALANPFVLVLKAICVCLLALGLDHLSGNPDHVSATFVAVLCVSPTVWLGLREAWAQMVGSMLGGIWGTLGALLGWPISAALPLAVGLSIGTTYLVRLPSGYRIAAFSALFILLVPFGSPWHTLEIRILSLVTGAMAGFLTNVVFSALNYRPIFQSRMDQVEAQVMQLLPVVLAKAPAEAEIGFNWLQALRNELEPAMEEMKWRKNDPAFRELEAMWWRLANLKYLLHLVYELSALRMEQGLSKSALQPLIAWLQTPLKNSPPGLPIGLQALGQRFWETWQHLWPTAIDPTNKTPAATADLDATLEIPGVLFGELPATQLDSPPAPCHPTKTDDSP